MDVATTLANTTAAIAAIGGLGTAAYGLVDASKAFWGGVSNVGYGDVVRALDPFKTALVGADSDWRKTVRAQWLNGVPIDDQKAAAKSLIRLGLSAKNAAEMANAGHVDAARLTAILTAIEAGTTLTTQDANVLGRFNGAIDAAMDGGFERGDQRYRNACRFGAGVVAVVLAVWGGALVSLSGGASAFQSNHGAAYFGSPAFWTAVLVGLVAVPIAPVAKDLSSSLQAAVKAVTATKS